MEGTVIGGIAQVEVNGLVANLSGTTFDREITLTTGTNTITVIAFPNDDDCTSVQRSITLIYDPNPACEETIGLVVDRPNDGTRTTSRTIVVEGSVSDTGAVVKVNGDTVTVDDNGDYSTTVSLSRGDNTITVTAENDDADCDEEITLEVERRSS